MSGITIFFVLVILISVTCTILLNSVISKVGKMEISQREFFNMQIGLKKPEDLEAARQSYDEAVLLYNESIGRFPGIIVAGVFGFKAISSEAIDENFSEEEEYE